MLLTTIPQRSTSPSSSSASTSSPTSTSASASPAVATPPRSTPSARPSPSPSSPTTRSTSTSTPRTCSSRPSSSSTAPSSSPTTAAASPRSSAVRAPARASRSLTDKRVHVCARGGTEEERRESVVTFLVPVGEDWVDVRSRLGGGRFFTSFFIPLQDSWSMVAGWALSPPSHGEKADRDGHVRFDARDMIGYTTHETCPPRPWCEREDGPCHVAMRCGTKQHTKSKGIIGVIEKNFPWQNRERVTQLVF